eukprot:3812597-Pyramimonas_sp.AAC.1
MPLNYPAVGSVASVGTGARRAGAAGAGRAPGATYLASLAPAVLHYGCAVVHLLWGHQTQPREHKTPLARATR